MVEDCVIDPVGAVVEDGTVVEAAEAAPPKPVDAGGAGVEDEDEAIDTGVAATSGNVDADEGGGGPEPEPTLVDIPDGGLDVCRLL